MRTVRTAFVVAAASVWALSHLAGIEARAPGGAQQRAAATPPGGDLEVLQLRPNFYMITGAGGHVSVQIGDDGVIVVDSGTAARADAVVSAIKKLTPQPI